MTRILAEIIQDCSITEEQRMRIKYSDKVIEDTNELLERDQKTVFNYHVFRGSIDTAEPIGLIEIDNPNQKWNVIFTEPVDGLYELSPVMRQGELFAFLLEEK